MKRTLANILFLLGVLSPVVASAEIVEPGKDSGQNGLIYSPIGKRDPFKAPPTAVNGSRDIASLEPLEQFSIEQLQLRGILRGSGGARAMFEDPGGGTYILQQGD